MLLAQEPPSRRVTGEEKAATAEVRINQIETSEFPKVTIFATVLKDDSPVQGLSASDFRVREDEVDQEPITVVPKLTPLSVVLTLDTSGSMKKRLADAQAAAKSFLDTLEAQDKAQVIRFSRDVSTIFPLGNNRAAAGAAIDSTVARGDTALWDALHASLESLRTVAGRKAIVLLSDGVDDDGTGKPLSKKTVADVLALARQVNVPIYAIGLGTELDETNLKKVAYPESKPEGVSVTIDAQTGKRVGSYFFRTSDEIEQVHDFYEDKMTRATWDVSRAPTQVWGSSEAEGRKFEVTPERRGDDTRVRFEEKDRK
jgi:Mg-chelatase subunit ChlD